MYNRLADERFVATAKTLNTKSSEERKKKYG